MNTMIESIDKDQYLKTFSKKLNNFLHKSPLQVYVKIIEPHVYITIVGYEKKNIEYTLDYALDEKQNIFNVRNLLYDEYPIITTHKVKKRKATAQESESLIQKQEMSIEEALNYEITEEIKKTYKITKVIIERDELFVTDMDTEEDLRFRLRYPVTLFLTKIWDKDFSKEDLGQDFLNNSIFITKLRK